MADNEQLLITLGVQDKGASKQINAINKEIKALEKEFKSANSISKDFEKSSEGLRTKLTYLEKSFTANNTKLDSYKRKMQEAKVAIASKEVELNRLNSAEEVNQKAVNKVTEQLDKMRSTLRQTEQNISLTENELQRLTNEINNTNTALNNDALNKYKQHMQEVGQSVQNTGERISKVGQVFSATGVSLMTLSAPLVAFGAYATKSAIDFESAFTGVKKTVDATDEQLSKLKDGILNMSKVMPESASDIAKVAESAGQLGIKTANIESFTKTMVMLGDSTNLSSDQAATALARLANITGMPQENFQRLGSVIVALGNNLATTESEITEMGLRLAGAGHQVGMSEAQILSFAGALSSVGIEAEAGGSAFSKVMVDMQLATETGGESLNNFAKVAGMSSQDFQKAFKEDASGALLAFIKGLQNTGTSGESAIKVLDDMGITEVRMRDALLRASGASDKFSNAINIGTTAWTENTALTKEAETRYATMASEIEMAKNKLKALGIELGENLMPFVSEFIGELENVVSWFGSLDKSTQEAIIKFGLLTFATGGVLTAVGKVTTGIGDLVTGGGKLISWFGASATEAGSLTSGLGALSSVALPLAGVIAGVGSAVYLYNKEQDALNKTVTTSSEEMGFLETALNELNGVHIKSKEELEKLGLVYKDFNENISDEFKTKVEESTDVINDFNFYLGQINMDGVITEEESSGFTTRISTMVDNAISAIQGKQSTVQTELGKMFTLGDGVIDESEQQVLNYLNKNYTTNITEITKLKDEINAIYKKGIEERGQLNEEEIKQIQEKNAKIKQIELEALANNEQEQLFAKNEFINRVKQVDADGAKELLVNQKKILDEQNAQTLASYDTQIETMRTAREKAEGADRENLDKQIQLKTEERDKIIEKQRETWQGCIDVVEEMNPNLVGTINKYSGEILTNQDIQAQKGLTYMQQHYDNLNTVTEDGWVRMRNTTTGSMDDIYVTVDKNTGEITAAWNETTGVVGGYTDEMKTKVKELGAEHESQKLTISSDLGAIAGASVNAKDEMVNAFGEVIGKLENVTTASDGTKQGIIDLNGTPVAITTNADGTITSMHEVKNSVEEIPTEKNVTISFWQKGLNAIKSAWDSITNKNVSVDENATGTYNYTGSGLSTIDESGWELASNNSVSILGSYSGNTLASIPSGTSIRTHMQSVADMKAEISKQINSLLANKNYTNSSNNQINYSQLTNAMTNAIISGFNNIGMSVNVEVDSNGIVKNAVNKTLDTLKRQTKNNSVSKGR